MIKIKKTKFNIFVLGDSQVGKTCMIKTLRENTFNIDELPTIGLETYIDTVSMDDINYKFKIFDLSGREKYKNLVMSKLRLADGFILVFSVDNNESLKQIDYWLRIIDETVKSKRRKILIGNKIDIKKREILNQDAVNFAKERNMKYFETSAKTGFNIKETFNRFFLEFYDLKNQYEIVNNI